MRKHIGVATIAGALGVLPFVVLELINRRLFDALAPRRGVRRSPRPGPASPPGLGLGRRGRRADILIAWVWGSFVADQMPCFLGVPNCD